VPQELFVEHGITIGASFRAEVPYSGPGDPLRCPKASKGSADYLAVRSCYRVPAQEPAAPAPMTAPGWASGVTICARHTRRSQLGERVKFAGPYQAVVA